MIFITLDYISINPVNRAWQIFDAVGWGNFDRPQGEPPGPTERRRRRKRERGEEEEEGEEEIM